MAWPKEVKKIGREKKTIKKKKEPSLSWISVIWQLKTAYLIFQPIFQDTAQVSPPPGSLPDYFFPWPMLISSFLSHGSSRALTQTAGSLSLCHTADLAWCHLTPQLPSLELYGSPRQSLTLPCEQRPPPSRPSTNISLTKIRGRGVKTKEPLFTDSVESTVKGLCLQDRVQGSATQR